MSELTALTIRRGQLKAQLTRLATYLRDNVDHNIDIDQVKLRAEKARETWDDFQSVQAQIEEQDEANEETEKYRDEFEELFYKNLAKCERLLRESSERASSTASNGAVCRASTSTSNGAASGSNVTNMQSTVKLAALQIPEFSGVYTEWAAFYDIFSALVHENEALSDIQKFFYLRSALTGDAENVIKCFQTTANNYRMAWEGLIKRYDNKKVLIQVHTQAVFEIEPIKKESAIYLRKLVDALNGHLKALESLGESPNQWGSLLLYLITSKLDAKTMREWEIVSSKSEVSSVTELINFLQSRFRILEAVESSKQINLNQENNFRKSFPMSKKTPSKSHLFAATGQIKCYLCKQAHTVYRCPSLLNLSVVDRIKKVSDLKLCKICLRAHEGERCRARPCPICSHPHNSLLHLPARTDKKDNSRASSMSSPSSTSEKRDDENVATASVSINAYAYNKNNYSQILLSTATVLAYNYERKPVLCRVLLDSGSQHNFVTESLAQHLRLKCEKTSCTVVGINGSAHKSSYLVSTTIKSRISNFSASLDFFVLPRLTNTIPLMPIDVSTLNLPANLELADPSFGTPQTIDMLLGAEIFFDLIINNQLRPVAHGPVVQNTRLGWIIAGPVPRTSNTYEGSSVSLFAHNLAEHSESLENQMAKFWRLEEVKHDYAHTLEERACKQHFEKTVRRDDDGRFIVSLPFREALKLGKSYDAALRRFLALERRFQSNKNLKVEYIKFMREYYALGHMSIAKPEVTESCYYLPHHAVLKESSTTTKLRVVFDASSKTDNGLSLNDVLLKGPCIQEELVSTMSRFRTHKFVLTADIKKMYRQIWIPKNQQNYHRILWRENPDQPLNIFSLKTVTYGVITASYLATACLKKLSEDEVNTYPEACRALSEDFYVDDFLGGASTLTKTLKLRDDLIALLKSAGMELCKWSSNEPELLTGVATVPNNVCQDSLSSTKNVTKVLGLYWNQVNDSYQYKVSPYIENAPVTKRIILAEVASIFDPLGLISPVIIRFKIIMQNLWQLKADWDELLPSNIEEEWRENRKNLMHLNLLVIKRSIIGDGEAIDFQLHGFADASMTAYGACLYLRVVNSDGICVSNLVCSKSRVAPLKSISIPRLELLAAVLLARLTSKYAASLRLPNVKIFYWSDSTVVLAWIASQSSRWKTFVANRVGEIHERTSLEQWYHVRTQDNPADIVSRGCHSYQIKDLKLWWNGPDWLVDERARWPKGSSKNDENYEILTEEKKLSHVVCTSQYDLSFLNRYSTLFKLLRVMSYCRRFKHNALSKTDRISGPIRVAEINGTIICIIKQIQRVSFERDIFDLQNLRPVHTKSSLLRLKPFLDENGLIRVGGRLTNASTLNISQRHPIILPAKCFFTKLIFLQEHLTLLHGGPQAMLASIRLKYWPLNGRNIARSVARSCVKCFKYRPTVLQPIMGDLPKARVEPARAFIKTGVDFAGPFHVKAGLRRNAPINKTYACIWVCLTTKAVHIELVGDLTTQSFLNALQRFCDRRGLCTDIYSDNATNFVGANRHLQELKSLFLSETHQEQVHNTLSKRGIQWHFIPPRSPHFGGLWEAAVKSLKSHLYKTLGNAALTFEELNTLLVRIEAILNSRPLIPLSTDPSDLSVLTPAHFLIGDSLCALPDRDETVHPTNRLSRWRRVAQVSQHLWSRWSRDYLGQLQERSKWSTSRGPRLQVGTIVLVKDDNLPPLQWSIGRVISTHGGTDDQVRVATIKTCRGEFKRAVRNLCPLPFEGNQPNDV